MYVYFYSAALTRNWCNARLHSVYSKRKHYKGKGEQCYIRAASILRAESCHEREGLTDGYQEDAVRVGSGFKLSMHPFELVSFRNTIHCNLAVAFMRVLIKSRVL